ncbi:centromere protein X isoform X4 [Pongo pygmaeus]|uniref:centromere protein X isoform X4 n=1 Tax=Pongo pygmaeus TaxID=9600 RepID=UPI00300D63ED
MEGPGAGSGFRKELVSRLLHLHFKDDKTKEAAVRGVRQAQAEDALRVDVDQLEKVLPQLVREHGSGRKWGCPAGWP